MRTKPLMVLNVAVTICLVTALLLASRTLTGGSGDDIKTTSSNVESLDWVNELNPWADINDDGKVDIVDLVLVIRYYGTSGRNLTKAAIAYDSGWADITDKCGQYFNIAHNLNSTNVIVDITGKATIDGGIHQRHLGGTGYTPGWWRPYGGNSDDKAFSLGQTSDGGYALAGDTTSFGAGSADYWLVKTDPNGVHEWDKTYGEAGGEYAYSVVQTNDEGYALTGYKVGDPDTDFWLVKTYPNGTMQWNQIYGGAGDDNAYSGVQTSDGGYALTGFTASFGAGGYDFWLVKTYPNGTMQWNQTYGGAKTDIAYSVIQTSDGGYAMAGYTGSFGAAGWDLWLVKTCVESGLAWTDSTANSITLYRSATDPYWNYVRVRIWKIKD